MIDWGLIAILGLGILLGGLLFGGPGFRRKFFMGFRKFLGGVGGGQTRRKDVDPHDNTSVQQVTRRHRPQTIYLVVCPECKGEGKIPRRMPKMADKRLMRWDICPMCKGEGKVDEKMLT